MCQIFREIVQMIYQSLRGGILARSMKGPRNQLDFLKRATRKSREQTRPGRARLALPCPTPSKQQPVGLSNARTALKTEHPIDTNRLFLGLEILVHWQHHWIDSKLSKSFLPFAPSHSDPWAGDKARHPLQSYTLSHYTSSHSASGFPGKVSY